MKYYDKRDSKRIYIKGYDLSRMIANINSWNKLSFYDEDPKFAEEFNRAINNPDVPHGLDDKKGKGRRWCFNGK